MPGNTRGRTLVMPWLMFQMGGTGPMFGQCHHFRNDAPEPVPYAIDRYTRETARLYGVLDKRLGEADYMAGDYSIANMAIYLWTRSIKRQGGRSGRLPMRGPLAATPGGTPCGGARS